MMSAFTTAYCTGLFIGLVFGYIVGWTVAAIILKLRMDKYVKDVEDNNEAEEVTILRLQIKARHENAKGGD